MVLKAPNPASNCIVQSQKVLPSPPLQR